MDDGLQLQARLGERALSGRLLVCDEVEAELCHGGEGPLELSGSQSPRCAEAPAPHKWRRFLLQESLQSNPHHRRPVRWPSGPRRQVKVTLTSKFLVLERGREFESHSYQHFFLSFLPLLFAPIHPLVLGCNFLIARQILQTYTIIGLDTRDTSLL